MNKPLVSIIVPCYNQAQYLAETLDSVESQTYSNWECIIVNDGSQDNSESVAEQYCQNDKRFRYLYQINSGVSIARNYGIRVSKGEYILPLDGDDIIERTFLEKTVSFLESHEDYKLVYSNVVLFGGQKGVWPFPEYDYSYFIWDNCIVNTALFRRSDFEKTSGYNPNMKNGYEDWDFWLSFLSPEDKVYRIEENLFFYRKSNNSRNTNALKNENSLLRQIFINHRSIYDKYVPDIVAMGKKIAKLESENNRKNNYINCIFESTTYKIGKCILSPFRFLYRFFKTFVSKENI